MSRFGSNWYFRFWCCVSHLHTTLLICIGQFHFRRVVFFFSFYQFNFSSYLSFSIIFHSIQLNWHRTAPLLVPLLLNDTKMTPKWHQNDTKMTPKWHQNDKNIKSKFYTNDTKMTQKWHKNDINIKPDFHQNLITMTLKWHKNDTKMTNVKSEFHKNLIILTPKWHQNDTKMK